MIKHKDIKGETFYNGKPKPPSPKSVEKHEFKPRQLSMFKKIKTAILKKFIPTLREVLDVDLDVDYDNGVVTVYLGVYLAGERIYGRQKAFKV